MRFNYSSYGDYQQCPRRWYLKNIKKEKSAQKSREIEHGLYLHNLFQSLFESPENVLDYQGNVSPLLKEQESTIKKKFMLTRKYLFDSYVFLGSELHISVRETFQELFLKYGIVPDEKKFRALIRQYHSIEFSGIIDILLYDPGKHLLNIVDVKTTEIKKEHSESARRVYIKKKYSSQLQLGFYGHILNKICSNNSGYLHSLLTQNNNIELGNLLNNPPTIIWNYLIIFFKEDAKQNKVHLDIDIISSSFSKNEMLEIMYVIENIATAINELQKMTNTKIIDENFNSLELDDLGEKLTMSVPPELEDKIFPPKITKLCGYCQYMEICKQRNPTMFNQ